MIKTYLIILLSMILFLGAQGQNYSARTYHFNDSNYSGQFSDVLLHPNGFLYVRGTHLTNNMGVLQYLIKMDTLGNYHWVKEYQIHTSNRVSIELDTDSNIILNIAKSVIPYSLNIFLKLDTAGNILQQKYFSNYATAPIMSEHKVTQSGYIVCGLNVQSVFGGQPHSGLAGYLDKSFEQKWIKVFYTQNGENIRLDSGSDILSDHSIIFSGIIRPSPSSNLVSAFLLIKTDTLGNILLAKRINVDEGTGSFLIDAKASEIVLNITGIDHSDYFSYSSILRLDSNLNVINVNSVKTLNQSSIFAYPRVYKTYDGYYYGFNTVSLLYYDSLFNAIYKTDLDPQINGNYSFMEGMVITKSKNLIMAGFKGGAKGAILFADSSGQIGCSQTDTTLFNTNMFFYSQPISLSDSSLYLAFDSTAVPTANRTLGYDVYCNTTAIEENNHQLFDPFQVYPVPFSNRLHLKCKANIQQIKLYNVLGQLVFSKQYNEYITDDILKTDNLKKGIYIINVVINENIWSSKMIVKID